MRVLTCGACVVALIFPSRSGPASLGRLADQLGQRIQLHRGPAPAGGPRQRAPAGRGPAVAEYYLPAGANGSDGPARATCPALRRLHRRRPATAGVILAGNRRFYAVYITNGYFSLVALNFADTTALDHELPPTCATITTTTSSRSSLRHRSPSLGVGTYVVWRYEANTYQQSGYTPRQ